MRTLVEVKAADLIGPALDWAVAKALGYSDGVDAFREPAWIDGERFVESKHKFRPSTNWRQCGPLIGQCLTGLARMGGEWCAFALEGKAAQVFAIGEGYFDVDAACADGAGDTELIAICRAVVAAKLGDVVQVPAELLERAV